MSDILKLLSECNAHVNGDCRTLACRQPDGSFSCPTKRVAAELTRLREHNDALRAECKAERAAVTTRVVHGTPMLAMLVDDRIGDPKILTLHNARACVDELGAMDGGTHGV